MPFKLLQKTIGRLRCLFRRHEPNRRRVHKQPTGQHYGYCRHCGIQIRRRGYQDWVPDEWDRKLDQDPD